MVRLLEELRANGLDDSTIVVFTADHGELGGAHHVPLMIVHPAYPGGRSTKAVSSQIDLAPTLLALTGEPADAVAHAGAGLKGRDLSNVLSAPEQGSTTTVRPAALFNYHMFSYLDAKWLGAMVRIRASKGPTMVRWRN